MIKTCCFLLRSGRPCQAPARHRSDFCRHHDPSQPHPARSAASRAEKEPALAANAGPSRAQVSAYWRTYPATIVDFDEQGLQESVEYILEALAHRNICHRSAGRILAAIADRRLALAKQKQHATLCHFFESVGQRNPEVLKNKEKLFEGLRELPLIDLSELQGPVQNPTTNRSATTSPLP